MPFAATWMDLEIIILSKSDRERQIPDNITFMWNLKYDTNELIYETETDLQTENRLVVAKGEWVGERRTGISELADVNYYGINNNVLPYSTGNNIQYPVINHNGKEYEKVYICITESLCCTAEINTSL